MTARRFSIAAAAILAMAAPTAAAAAEKDVKPLEPSPLGVAVVRAGDAWVLAARGGKTLYTYVPDWRGRGRSESGGMGAAEPVASCIDACATSWRYFAAPSDAKPLGPWKPFKRSDGALQWAYKSRPVYTFTGDHRLGDLNGDGLSARLWEAVRYTLPAPKLATPPSVQVRSLGGDYVFADPSGMTLYTRRAGSCSGRCLTSWRPFEAPALARPVGDWTPVRIADGAQQWAYKGKSLFLFDGGGRAGEALGDDLDGWITARP